MARQNAPFFRVYNSENQKVTEHMKTGKTPEESYAALYDFISRSSGDWVTIQIFTRLPNKTEDGEVKLGRIEGQTKFVYRVMLQPSINSPLSGNRGMNGGSDAYLGAIADMRVQMAEMKKDAEIAELNRTIAGLKDGGGNDPVMKEIIGFAKEWMLGEKIKLRPEEKKETEEKKVEDQNISSDVGIVGSTVKSVTTVLKEDTGEFLSAVKYYAEHSPDQLKLIADSLITQVREAKA